MLRLLAYGGLRIGEAFALQWSDVDPKRRTLTVRRSVSEVNGRLIVGPTKTYATRTITLPDVVAVSARRDEKLELRLVFPGRTGNFRRYGNFRRDAWNPACEVVSRRYRTTSGEPAPPS